MIKQLLASTALAAALMATPAMATHEAPEEGPSVDLSGKSEHAPGQQAQETGDPATAFAPGQVKDEGESARDAAPGQHDAGENGNGNGNGNSNGNGDD